MRAGPAATTEDTTIPMVSSEMVHWLAVLLIRILWIRIKPFDLDPDPNQKLGWIHQKPLKTENKSQLRTEIFILYICTYIICMIIYRKVTFQ